MTTEPQRAATADPLANAPPPSPNALRAATYATLDREAISEEAGQLQVWVAQLIEEHELRAGLRKRRRKAEPRENFEKAIGALVADLLAAPQDEPQLGLIYRSLNSTAVSKGPLTYDGFVTAIDAMRERDLIEVFAGFHSAQAISWGDGQTSVVSRGMASRFRATPTLRLLASVRGIECDHLEAHFERRSAGRVLALKGKSLWVGAQKIRGPGLELPDTPAAKALSARVRALNDFIDGVEIGGGRHERFFRSFAMGDQPDFAWNKGGRLYSDGRGNYQQAGKAERLAMTLDGEPVVEIDVKASFLTILHGLTGASLEMGDDAYAFAGATREIAKGWLTASIGSGKPISRWPKEMSKEYLSEHGQDLRQTHPVRSVEAAMTLRFPILGDLAALGLGWADLMFVESEAIIGTMEGLMEQGTPSLPVHDSLIVPASAEALTSDILKARYLEHARIEPRLTVHRPSS